jgi:hypothetical protein
MLVDSLYYCYWFRLYKGKNTTDEEKEKTREIYNAAISSLPKDLGSYAVYVDNYYRGLDLVYNIDDRGFSFTFNCRSNRPAWLFSNGLHKEFKAHQGVEKFACKVHKERDMAALSWTDKKVVNYITNQFIAEVTTV